MMITGADLVAPPHVHYTAYSGQKAADGLSAASRRFDGTC